MNSQSQQNLEDNDDTNPSNNQRYGTESPQDSANTEEWDPIQDENDVPADDSQALKDEGTEDLDTDESTGNSGL